MCDTDCATVADIAASSTSALTAVSVPARPGKAMPVSFRTVLCAPSHARDEDTIRAAGAPGASVQRHRQTGEMPTGRLRRNGTLGHRVE